MIRKAFALAASIPWAIQAEWLATILQIANREGPGPEAVETQLGRPLQNTQVVTLRDGVAIVPVVGPIFRYANVFSAISGGTSIEILARDFRAALEDPSVRAILLNIDSPGGEVTGVNEFAQMVFDARGVKPIAAYVGGLGASAAYWIASAAGEIVADSTARVGSIGVVQAVPNPDAKLASEIEIVSSQSPDKRPNVATKEGRAVYQANVDAMAEIFIETVARNRGVDSKAVGKDFGRGGVMLAGDAAKAGMVDSLGSFEGTITMLGNRAMQSREKRKMATANKALGLSESASESEGATEIERLRQVERDLLALTGKASSAEAFGAIEGWKLAGDEVPKLTATIALQEKAIEDRDRADIFAKLKAEKKITPALMKQFAGLPLDALRGFAAVAPVITALAAEPVDDAPTGTALSFNGKTWTQMTPAEKHVLHETNPDLFKSMRADHQRNEAAGL